MGILAFIHFSVLLFSKTLYIKHLKYSECTIKDKYWYLELFLINYYLQSYVQSLQSDYLLSIRIYQDLLTVVVSGEEKFMTDRESGVDLLFYFFFLSEHMHYLTKDNRLK